MNPMLCHVTLIPLLRDARNMLGNFCKLARELKKLLSTCITLRDFHALRRLIFQRFARKIQSEVVLNKIKQYSKKT